MREMRRKDRAITEEESIAILDKAEYGILSTVTENGKPYGIPVNYCVIDSCIYFHCAVEGQKIDNIEKNKSVSFCIVGNTKILPDEFGTKYESVVAAGEIEEVFEREKQVGLEGLVLKYSPDFIPKGNIYIEDLRDKTRVFKISVDTLTGKAEK
jgi:nitroimidazol reductase NimA-like FMN-containing flavoprotein (pyridoxamine 5'-phosphate oxidase superfamily)